MKVAPNIDWSAGFYLFCCSECVTVFHFTVRKKYIYIVHELTLNHLHFRQQIRVPGQDKSRHLLRVCIMRLLVSQIWRGSNWHCRQTSQTSTHCRVRVTSQPVRGHFHPAFSWLILLCSQMSQTAYSHDIYELIIAYEMLKWCIKTVQSEESKLSFTI